MRHRVQNGVGLFFRQRILPVRIDVRLFRSTHELRLFQRRSSHVHRQPVADGNGHADAYRVTDAAGRYPFGHELGLPIDGVS